jgi:hypothetical protein
MLVVCPAETKLNDGSQRFERLEEEAMNPQKKFQLVFSCLMGTTMISIMTFV